MASTDETSTAFKCEEFDEYLLIEDVGVSTVMTVDSKIKSELEPEQITEPHCIRTEGSLDSGYEGKHSRTASPGEVKPNGTAQEQPEVATQQDCQAEEDWCIIEHEKHRPQGLYGYRYVDYDDQEAEGNIHITDEDL